MSEVKKIFFIPARSGSQRIPGKNHIPINNKPLVEYSIEFALSVASTYDSVIVSTDSQEVMAIASKYQDVILHKRPNIYATNKAKMIDVTLDFIQNSSFVHEEDVFVLLQPTTPFRNTSTYYKLIETLESNLDATSALSVVDVDFYHPSKMGRIDPQSGFHLLSIDRQDNLDNHDKDPYYIISGTFYISRVKDIRSEHSFIGSRPFACLDNIDEFVNINVPSDLSLANLIARSIQ